LTRFGLEYLAPVDLATLPDRSVDVIVSRAVLEHIPLPALEAITAQCRRVLAPGGYICHVVDNTDHYAHGDRSIDYANFLKFDDWQWRLLTLGPLSFTNRLRHSDYRALFERAGLRIVKEHRNVDARSLDALRSRRLAPAFRGRDFEDLATATSLFVARSGGDAR
jgi:SAM-dependent methyltransferase